MQDATQSLEQFSPCASQGASKPKDRRGGKRANQTGRPPTRVVIYPEGPIQQAILRITKERQIPRDEIVLELLEYALRANGQIETARPQTIVVGGTYRGWRIIARDEHRPGYYRVGCPRCEQERIKNRDEMGRADMCSRCAYREGRSR